MNIQAAKEEIKRTIQIYLRKDEKGKYIMPYVRQRPILLIGPPGIGKTAIAEQIADEMGISLVSYSITHHTRQSAVGLPKIDRKKYGGSEYEVTVYTMSEIIESVYQKIEESGIDEGILFIDEINCASETLAPAMLQFLQCKTFGRHKVPDGWVIVGAGNPPDYNRSVKCFDVVTLDRVRKITVEADCDAWIRYAEKNNIHPSVSAYMEYNRDAFYKLPYFDEFGEKSFVTARGWEDLSEMIKGYERYVCDIGVAPENCGEKISEYINSDFVYEFIQDKEISQDFAAFFEIFMRYDLSLDINDILDGKVEENIISKLKENQGDRFSIFSRLYEVIKNYSAQLVEEYDSINELFPILKRIKSSTNPDIEIKKFLKDNSSAKYADIFAKSESMESAEKVFSNKVKNLKENGEKYSVKLDNAAEFMQKAAQKGNGDILVFSRRFLAEQGCFRAASLFPSKKFNKLIDLNSGDRMLNELIGEIEEFYYT